MLAAGIVIHLGFLLSLRFHWLDPLFLEAMKAYGQAADFFGIHQAGRNLLDGLSIYDSANYRNEAVPIAPYLYFYRYLPPTAYLAAPGAAFLAPWTAYWIWVLLNELLLLALLASLWRWPGIPTPVREMLVGLTLAFGPFYLEQWMGQFSFAMALFLWLVLRGEFGAPPGVAPAARESLRALLRSAAFWGWVLSLLLKSYSLLFALVFFLQGRWRRVLLAGALVLLATLPYFAAHLEDLGEFARLNLRPYPPSLLPVRYGPVAVVQFLAERFLGASEFRVDLGLKVVRAAELPVYLWIAAVGLASLFVSLRTHRHARSEQLLVLWILTFFAVYKDIWEYHHVMLLPALYVFALRDPSPFPFVLLAWFALPSANVFAVDFWRTVPMNTWSLATAALHHASYALPVTAFYVFTVRRCLEADRTDRRTASGRRARPRTRGMPTSHTDPHARPAPRTGRPAGPASLARRRNGPARRPLGRKQGLSRGWAVETSGASD